MSIDRRYLARAVRALLGATVTVSCGASGPATAASLVASPPRRTESAPTSPVIGSSTPEDLARARASSAASTEAKLVVHRDVVAECPTLGLERAQSDQFHADMNWLSVLDAIADCMRTDGPLSQRSLGVSGDEAHRLIVREVLGSRGIAPTRVIAMPVSAEGAAECQGGSDCDKRIEITIAAGLPGR